MFSILSETNLNFLVTFILLSAKAFNLDWFKILPFGKELNNIFLKLDDSHCNRIHSSVIHDYSFVGKQPVALE